MSDWKKKGSPDNEKAKNLAKLCCSALWKEKHGNNEVRQAAESFKQCVESMACIVSTSCNKMGKRDKLNKELFSKKEAKLEN